MTVKVFVLTPFIQKILRGKGLIKPCRECAYCFRLGDVIVSRQGGKCKTKWYCRKCAIRYSFI
jgi:hypothetical protein